MKKLFRMIVFTGLSLYLTSLWNKGFILPNNLWFFTELVIFTVIIYYLLVPVSKIILFPINLITFGLGSFLLYLLLIYFLDYFALVTIKNWQFPGFSFVINIPKVQISYLGNVFLSSVSLSSIINLLERIV